jgi:hypothetical protein
LSRDALEDIKTLAKSQYTSFQASISGAALKEVLKTSNTLIAYMGLGCLYAMRNWRRLRDQLAAVTSARLDYYFFAILAWIAQLLLLRRKNGAFDKEWRQICTKYCHQNWAVG